MKNLRLLACGFALASVSFVHAMDGQNGGSSSSSASTGEAASSAAQQSGSAQEAAASGGKRGKRGPSAGSSAASSSSSSSSAASSSNASGSGVPAVIAAGGAPVAAAPQEQGLWHTFANKLETWQRDGGLLATVKEAQGDLSSAIPALGKVIDEKVLAVKFHGNPQETFSEPASVNLNGEQVEKEWVAVKPSGLRAHYVGRLFTQDAMLVYFTQAQADLLPRLTPEATVEPRVTLMPIMVSADTVMKKFLPEYIFDALKELTSSVLGDVTQTATVHVNRNSYLKADVVYALLKLADIVLDVKAQLIEDGSYEEEAGPQGGNVPTAQTIGRMHKALVRTFTPERQTQTAGLIKGILQRYATSAQGIAELILCVEYLAPHSILLKNFFYDQILDAVTCAAKLRVGSLSASIFSEVAKALREQNDKTFKFPRQSVNPAELRLEGEHGVVVRYEAALQRCKASLIAAIFE